ncbi:DnaJ subfamily C member 12 [Orchesella cincta]|uniref:DnaJ subfamily C member 12 n=1 Tax=Orchesella cincta TaxID=48709 RepID=A0A1D2MVM1_ORCCI|nr:DnaJ subfamily C member 12 [Orchesella cincta]
MARGGGGDFGVGAILQGRKGDEDDYFKILGCSDTSTDEQITTEYKIRALKFHPDKHPGDEKALEQFQKLQEARDVLLDPEKRQKYEKWRQAEMCIPYKQWLSMSSRCATTMHWAKPKEQTMIESGAQQKQAEMERDVEAAGAAASSSSSSEAEIKWMSSSLPSTTGSKTDHQQYVWRPEKTTSVYSKFRNYKI